MAFWNSGAIFNRRGNESGFTWNSKKFLFIIRINDTLKVSDNVSELLARLILAEKPMQFYDTLVNAAFYGKVMEDFALVDDDPFVTLLVTLVEEIGIKDEFLELIVKLYLEEKQPALDEIKLLVELLEAEDFRLEDVSDLQAFYDLLDRYSMEDLKVELSNFLKVYEGDFGLTDHDLKSAISDFVLGTVNTDDKAYDWFEPFHLLVDWSKTEISAAPEAELTSIELPGTDGSITQNTVYKDRLFTLMCYSEDGLTVYEKEQLKKHIVQVLDSTKHQHKTLTIQANSTQFNVKYTGQAEVESGPSFVRAKIPLHADPYGFSLFPYELYGSGQVSNLNGDAPLRVKHTISGPVTNPSFTLGAITYTWRGVVSSGSKLVISHDNYTCYTIDSLGNKRNALQFLTGEFQSIEAGKSMVLVASSNTERYIVTEWSTPVLW